MAGKNSDRPKRDLDAESQMVEADSSTNSTTSNPADQGSRSSNIQRILLRKERLYKLPWNQRLAKLSMYSYCQAADCRCTGWKTPDESRKGEVENDYVPDFSEECRIPNCQHPTAQ